jgi:pimeloyl-ACP methyl ester carboxylesterase
MRVINSVVAAVLLLGATAATAGECVNRRGRETLQHPAAVELVYQCLHLKSGAAIWVGEAGAKDLPAVLLVHGLGDNAHRDWQMTVPALVANYRVIALDLPGFGASPPLPGGYSFPALAQTFEELLDQKKIARAHVVGHSLGGALALYFAYAFPQRVDRVVLVDVAGILQKSIFMRHIAGAHNDLGRNLMREVDTGFDFSGWLAGSPGARKFFLGRGSQAETALGLVEYDFSPVIRGVSSPVTLVWGKADPVAPLRTGQLLASRLPNARLHILEGVGHVPMTQGTGRFNALLVTALGEPLSGKHLAEAAPEDLGDVVCHGQTDVHYSGHFASLTLDHCSNAVIESAQIGTLDIRDSQVAMYDVGIKSGGTAMQVSRSQVTGTALTIEGAIAIRAVESELDLAGVSIRAERRAVDMPASGRIYFSASDIQAPDFSGDAHFIRWPGNTWAPPAAAWTVSL